MRRTDREVTDLPTPENILQNCLTVHIGVQDGEGLFVVPMNYGYRLEGGRLTLYVHSAPQGRKASAFQKGGKVAFEMDCGHALCSAETACAHSYFYRSIMGSGSIRPLEDRAEKRAGLNTILRRLTGRSWEMPDDALDRTAVFAIEADTWTGKQNQPD